MSFWKQTTLDKLGFLKLANYIKFDSDFFGKYTVNFVSEKLVKGNLYVGYLSRYLNTKIKLKEFPIDTVCIKTNGINICSSILKKPSYLFHTMVCFVASTDISDAIFFKYCFDFSNTQQQWKKLIFDFGKTNDTISTKILLSLFIPNPSLIVQQKIGRIIANYDLLLENFKKQLTFLKKVRQQIFFEWFIKNDFLRYINYSFSDWNFSSWKKVSLKNLVEFERGSKIYSENFEEGNYPLFTASKRIQKINSYSYDKEVIILNNSINVSSAEYFVGKFEAKRQVYILTTEHKYIFWLLETINYFISWFNRASGTKIIKLRDVKDLVVSLPPDNFLKLFNCFADPIQAKIDNLIKRREILEKVKIELIEEIYSQNIEIN